MHCISRIYAGVRKRLTHPYIHTHEYLIRDFFLPYVRVLDAATCVAALMNDLICIVELYQAVQDAITAAQDYILERAQEV